MSLSDRKYLLAHFISHASLAVSFLYTIDISDHHRWSFTPPWYVDNCRDKSSVVLSNGIETHLSLDEDVLSLSSATALGGCMTSIVSYADTTTREGPIELLGEFQFAAIELFRRLCSRYDSGYSIDDECSVLLGRRDQVMQVTRVDKEELLKSASYVDEKGIDRAFRAYGILRDASVRAAVEMLSLPEILDLDDGATR